MSSGLFKKLWGNGRITFIICAASFLYLLNLSWLKYGDLIVDAGREMYVPLQLVQGKTLYKDFLYVYGPFSPYFNSLLFRFFGVHINSLIISGILTSVFTSIVIYKLSKIFLKPLFALLSVLTFLFVFCFGHYVYYGNYNFILPYSYPAIHSLLFALAGFYFLYKFLLNTKKIDILLCSLFIFLTIVSRFEIAVFLLFSVFIILTFKLLYMKGDLRSYISDILKSIVLPGLFGFTIYAIFEISAAGSLTDGFLNLIKSNLQLKSVFTSWLAGTDNIMVSLSEIAKALFCYACVFCVLFSGVFLVSKFKIKNNYLKRSVFFAIHFLVIGVLYLILAKFFRCQLQYRPIAVFVLAVLLSCFFRIIKRRDVLKNIFLAGFCVFSLLIMARMIFFTRPGHYGFYILVPSVIIYYIVMAEIIPCFIKEKNGVYLYNTGIVFISILFILAHFKISWFCYKHRSLTFASKRGNIYLFDNERERRCIELINYLQNNTNNDDTLVVFPEGIAINFFAERENPLYYYFYHPVHLLDESAVVKGIQEKEVDYIALVQRRTDEYGFPVFGRDYAKGLTKYLEDNYVLHKQFGFFPFTTENYGIALFKRKPDMLYNTRQ